jgi:hypothetical protein
MPTPAVLQKMRLQPGQTVLLLNATSEFASTFPAENPVSTEPEGQYDVVFLFAPDKATLEKLVPVARKAITKESLIWVAYPKGSSKMQTDLTRDKGWESVPETEWQFLNLISVDEKWSAFSFRQAGAVPTKGRRALRTTAPEPKVMPENPYIDSANRIVKLPEDLAELLAQNEAAAAFYEKLSFTNRKEYVTWITGAKRPETRQNRLQETQNKLLLGRKNPIDKGV